MNAPGITRRQIADLRYFTIDLDTKRSQNRECDRDAGALPELMGRIVGSIAAALVAATMAAMCAAEPVRAESSAAIMSQDVPITAADAEKAGTMPAPPPYDPTVVKYVDPGMPTPEPPDPRATVTPTPTAAP